MRRWAKEILERELRERERAEEEDAAVVDVEYESTSTAAPLALLLQSTAKIRLALDMGFLNRLCTEDMLHYYSTYSLSFVFRLESGV